MDSTTATELLLAPVAGLAGIFGAEARQLAPDRKCVDRYPDLPQFMLWSGWVPGTVGAFWIPGLYRSTAVHKILRADGNGGTEAVAQMRRYRSGLRDTDVGALTAIWSESDHGTLADQQEAVEALEAATGIRPGIICLSGDTDPGAIDASGVLPEHVRPGKSTHSYILLTAPALTHDPDDMSVWHHAIRAYCVALGGDPAATNVGRLMRIPGAIGTKVGSAHRHGVRIQTCLRTEEVRYPLADLDTQLTDYVSARWGVTVEEGYAALRTAARLHVLARHESSIDIAMVGDRVHGTRGSDTEAMEEANAILAAYGQDQSPATLCTGSVGATTAPTMTGTLSPDTVVRTRGGTTATIAVIAASITPGGHQAIHCPCHDDQGASATVLVAWTGAITVRCHSASCGGRWRVVEPVPELDPKFITTLLGDIESTSGIDMESQEDRDPLVDYLAPYRARVARKRAAAEASDPLVAEMAEKVFRRASDLYPRFRAHLKSQGITRRGSHCGTRSHALVHTAHGESLVRSIPCRGVSCAICGPHVLASKAAAIGDMSLLDKGRRLAGAPLTGRTVNLSWVSSYDVATWTRAFRRAEKEMSVRARTKDLTLRARTDISTDGENQGGMDANAYVMFDPMDGGSVAILSTLQVRLRGHDLPVQIVGARVIRSMAEELVEWTYTRNPGVVERVRGRIISTRNLFLRPDTLRAMARPSSWVLEQDATVPPARAAEVMEAEGVTVTPEAAGDGLVERAIAPATGIMRDPEARKRIMGLLAVESRDRSPSPRFTPVGVDLSEIEALLD